MFLKVIVLTILITSGFEKIKTLKFPNQGSQIWDISEESGETKEFSSNEYYTGENNEDISISMSDEVKEYRENQLPSLVTKGNNVPMGFSNTKNLSNVDESVRSPSVPDKFKRQTTIQQIINGNIKPANSFEDLSLSLSEETNESNISEIFSDKIKRQIQSQAKTDIQGNTNRFLSLLNLPLKLNVLANVLSDLNQEVVGTKGSKTGNTNQALNLVDLPVDVNAALNILSKVNETGESKTSGSINGSTNQQGLLESLLGGLLGGGERNVNLLGLLGGQKNNGLVASLLVEGLGTTLDDLLVSLLGNDAELGTLLGGILGSDQTNGLLAPLLENLLGAVGNIVENLLELLTALLESLLNGLSHTTLKEKLSQQTGTSQGASASLTQNINSTIDKNNQISSLINAPIKIEAFINILSSLKREITQQTNPNITTNSILGGGSSLSELTNEDTLIQGDNNRVSSLLNLAPDADVNLSLLSEITQLLNPGQNDTENNNRSNKGSGFDNPNEICFDVPIDQSGTPVVKNNDRSSGLVNVKPKINLDLNLLSKLTQTGGSIPSHIPTQRICMPRPTTQAPITIPTTTAVMPTANPNEICFDIPIDSSATSTKGDNNSGLVNIKPEINLDLNLLSKLTQTGGLIPSNIPMQKFCIPRQTTPTPTTIPTTTAVTPTTSITPTTNPNEICFDIPIEQSGSEALNMNPKLNLALNLLSQINQSGNSVPVKIQTQRICIPIPATPTTTTVKPTTIFTPASPLPTTEKRCFRRVCTRWLQTGVYKCLTQGDQYPKYTFTYIY